MPADQPICLCKVAALCPERLDWQGLDEEKQDEGKRDEGTEDEGTEEGEDVVESEGGGPYSFRKGKEYPRFEACQQQERNDSLPQAAC